MNKIKKREVLGSFRKAMAFFFFTMQCYSSRNKSQC